MANVTAFKALRYNPQTVRNLAEVVAFPPDPFVKNESGPMVDRGPFHINLLLELANSSQALALKSIREKFEAWRSQRVLIEDEAPSIYLAEERFVLQGRSYLRTMVYALIGTHAEGGPGAVIPHERTDPKRMERFADLLQTVQANISPVFALYDDPQGALRHVIQEAGKMKILENEFEFIDPRMDSPIKCVLYKISQAKSLEKISSAFKKHPLFIADGHHRYEAALSVGASHVLMGLAAVQDPGLQVLPIHRLVRVAQADHESFHRRLEADFVVKKLPESNPKWLDRDRVTIPPSQLIMVSKEGEYTLKFPDRMGGPVGLLLSLQHVLDDTSEVSFTVDVQAVKTHMGRGDYTHAFLVPPLNVREILQVVRRRGVLPVKSSYFFPKLFSGWVMAMTPLT